jgi:hypothetical protein
MPSVIGKVGLRLPGAVARVGRSKGLPGPPNAQEKPSRGDALSAAGATCLCGEHDLLDGMLCGSRGFAERPAEAGGV